MSGRLWFTVVLGIASLALLFWPVVALFTSGYVDSIPIGLLLGGILLNGATYNLVPEFMSRTASIGLMLVVFGLALISIDFGIAQSVTSGRYDHACLFFGILALAAGGPCLFLNRFRNASADPK